MPQNKVKKKLDICLTIGYNIGIIKEAKLNDLDRRRQKMKIVKGNRVFEISVKNVRYENGADVEVVVNEGDKKSRGHLGVLPNDKTQRIIWLRFGNIMNGGKKLEAITITDEQAQEIKAMQSKVADKHYTQYEKEQAWQKMGLISED